MSPGKPAIWGLTGGIASGKSAVAKILEGLGFFVIDADRVSRDLSQPGGLAHPAIVARFGTADRGELRKIIFGDARARKDLEAILHPMIKSESERLMKEAGRALVFYEASLLIEAGRTSDLAGLIVVEAPLERRRAWLAARDGIPSEAIDGILSAQVSDAERRKHATIVLENSGSPEELRGKVLAMVAQRGWKA